MTICFECDPLFTAKPLIHARRKNEEFIPGTYILRLNKFTHLRFVWLWFAITFDSRRLDKMLEDAREHNEN